MSIKEIAKILGSLYGQINEIERELRSALIYGLELERLIYSFPRAEEDSQEIYKWLVETYGSEDLLEAFRRAFDQQKRRVVRMGGKRCVILVTGSASKKLSPGLSEIANRIRRGEIRILDISHQPVLLMKLIDYDPDLSVLIFSGSEGLAVPDNPDLETRKEFIKSILTHTLGVNNSDAISNIAKFLKEKDSIFTLQCPDLDEPEGVEKCLGKVREALLRLGFSF